MAIKITDELKKGLLKEFNELPTLKEKFDFWKNTLQRKYVFFLMHYSPHLKYQSQDDKDGYFSSVFEFRINPGSPDENFDYNNQIFEDYKTFVDSVQKDKQILDLQALIDKFEADFEEVLDNNKEYIENEIATIKNLVSDKEKAKSGSESYNIDAIYISAYKQRLFKNKNLDLTHMAFDISNLIAAKNGETLASYHIFLKDKLEQALKGKVTKLKPLNIEQKFLILDYLGVFNTLGYANLAKHKSTLLALLLGVHPQTTKEVLSNFRDLKQSKILSEKVIISKNLKKVAGLFEDVGLKSVAKKVEGDLKKLEL